jgi:uncharacterized protein
VSVRTLIIAVGLAAGIAGLRDASAASFDCTKVTSASNVTVCSNPELSAKDDELDRFFRQREVELQSQGGDVHAFVLNERAWLAVRLTCNADLQCLNKWYDQRIADLRNLGLSHLIR